MAGDEFDIYQGPTGVTAVTNAVQRQILQVLAEGERQLPELVEITGKAKPTLSGIHMKELVNRELVTEHPHPKDSRRKVFRLNATRLGASGVPVDQLRTAVSQYAKTALAGPGVTLPTVFQVLAAAPENAPEGTIEAQARALGRACCSNLAGDTPRDFAASLARFVEKQSLVEHLQIDYEALAFRCRPGPGVPDVPVGRMGLLLAAFAEGAAGGLGMPEARFEAKRDGEAFRLQARAPIVNV